MSALMLLSAQADYQLSELKEQHARQLAAVEEEREASNQQMDEKLAR